VSDPERDGRALLADPLAEAAVLGSILLDRECAAEVFELVTPDDFDDPRHRRVFDAVRVLWDRGESIDFVTVADELERRGQLDDAGGRGFVRGLPEQVPTAVHALRHARIVRNRSIRRALRRVGVEICEIATQPERSTEGGVRALLDQAESKVFEIASREEQGKGVWLSDLLGPAVEKITNIRDRNRRHAGVESGFLDLDDMTAGLQPGHLVIVAGRPGMGKTAFGLNVAANAAMSTSRSCAVAIFSLEMSADELTNRMLCAEAGVDSHAVRTGRLPHDDLSQLTDAAARLHKARLYVDDSPQQTPFSIRARSRRLKARGDLDLVIVDYLQLVQYPEAENRVQEISAISRSLKALARELAVPVIAMSQLNRGTEKEEAGRRPRLADLRESGSIEQDADVVLLLFREEYYRPTEENRGRAEVLIGKQRNGPTGTVKLAFDGDKTRFRNLAYGRTEPT